ncbi:MAG: hypothetical protein KAI71_01150 [Candidatus Pacebacteria bacterium]|nr:hypothetical protein [Candidatus Paceibacterota bacterium]
MRQLSINEKPNIKKKILSIFILIIVLVVSLIFILYKNNILFSESISYESSDSLQDKDIVNNNIIKDSDQERKDDLFKIELALEKYYNENNLYPVSENGVRLDDKDSKIYEAMIEYVQGNDLQDPDDGYYYEYISDGLYFELSARLGNLDDEDCEIMDENICIYKKRTYGKIVKVLTQNEKGSDFLEKIISIDTDDTIIVSGNYLNDNNQKVIKILDPPENIKIKKVKEITETERKTNNLILIGNVDSNDLISNVYKKKIVIENLNLVDENNLYIATLKSSQSPWNREKDIFIIETGCLNGEISKEIGNVSVEKIDEDYYHILLTADSDKFTLVKSSKYRDEQSFLKRILELDGKDVEIYGYKKVCDFEKIILTDSIAVVNIDEIK